MAAAICQMRQNLVSVLLAVVVVIVNGQQFIEQSSFHAPNDQKDQDDNFDASKVQRRESDPSDHYFCGIGYADASASCAYPCPSGSKSECPPGYLCYFDTPCDKNNLPSQSGADINTDTGSSPIQTPTKTGKPTYPPQPTAAPWSEDDPRLSLFCGKDWADASATCQVWCPDGGDDVCPYGQVCFADTTCKHTRPPTNKPTKPQPTQSPTYHPTEPTQSPSVAPLLEQPSNHMFCATDVMRVAESCSLETHCPNGPSDCKIGTFCWSNVMECDVRDYIPWEEGGLLGKPESATSGMTDKEIALSLGFTWPSLKESDHYFCGISKEDANFRCGKSCTDGTALTCNHGQLCFYGTECDARVHPEYYETNEPTPATTPAPVNREDRVNFSFCGVDWAEANTCTTRWCGLDHACPEGKSCFADTECNAQDLPPMKPTKTPTWSPVTYDDEANTLFCGETFLDASAKCSYETYCRSGEHTECEKGQFCWPGVPCNIKDMVAPTTPRPTMDTAEPSKSPITYDDPSTTRFCGANWTDASASCTDGRRPQWCKTGSDTECSPGLICFADTMCHISTVVFPPSESPTLAPSVYTSPQPTNSAPEYDDAIFTSFCGPTYLEASASCSLDTYCPSGVHADCPNNQYCWASTTCNIHEFWPDPTPQPTGSPTLKDPPSESPSSAPSIEPTGLPTHSPLPEDDVRNFLYCGVDWADASSKCRIKCPNQICPPPLSCFSGTGCPAIPNDSPAPTDPDPSMSPTLLIESTPSSTSSETNAPGVAGSYRPTVGTGVASSSASETPIPTSSSDHSRTANPTTTIEDHFASGNTHTMSPISATTWRPANSESPLITSQPTIGMHTPGHKILSIPDVDSNKTPKSQPHIIQTVENQLKNIRPTLESEIFVVETRGGSVLPSNVYKFDGFISGLLYYSASGVNDDHFYLGDDDTIQEGLVNLALFCAKVVTDAIAYENCDPNKLACGMWAFDATFNAETRIQCSSSSEDAGLECLDGSIGCACILGVLDHYVGSKASSGSTPYSGAQFCSTDPYESVCSKYVEKSEDLRWLTPMAFWISYVQRYQEYKVRLSDFVQSGMEDLSFVEFVAGIRIHESVERAPKEKFLAVYQKVINLLLDDLTIGTPGQSTILTTKIPTDSPTSRPTGITVPTPRTPMPSTIVDNQSEVTVDSQPSVPDDQSSVKKCPFLCVVPIKTIECPSPGHKLKQCFSNFIGVDELCIASYGECDTSKVSVNDCGKSYNVFRRIDCSILVDYPHPIGEEALESSSAAPILLDSPSFEPASNSNSPSKVLSQDRNDSELDSSQPSSSETPTATPTSGFGGMVWWEVIASSGGQNCQLRFYMKLVFVAMACTTTYHSFS